MGRTDRVRFVRDSLLAAGLAGSLLAGTSAAQSTFLQWDGDSIADSFGYSVDGAGDVNGDGFPDVIVGAPENDPSGIAGAGSAFVYSGSDGALIWARHGTQVNEEFGKAVAGVGDLDHDGFDDFAVGAPGWDNAVMVPDVGAVHVYDGQTGVKMFVFGGTQTDDLYGYSLDGCGDWNGDGTPDIVVGIPNYDVLIFGFLVTNAGRAVIISGTTPSSILQTYSGGGFDENFGWSVAGIGDWNADGFEDVVVGSPFADTTAADNAGRARVYSGSTKALVFTAEGTELNGGLGIGVGGAGDVNNDGRDDIVVGAYGESGTAGAVHIYLGPLGGVSWIKLGDAGNDRLGYDVDGVGDANRDGFDDFAGGAYGAGSPGYFKVWSGKDGTLLYGKINGPAGSEQFGTSLAGAGDLDQDGWVDLLVGDNAFDGAAGSNAGRAWAYDVVFHQQNWGFAGPGTGTLDMYGTPLASGGHADLHLDGAKPVANAWLIASAFQVNAPFKGGILVPQVAGGLITPFLTDAQGDVKLLGLPGGGGPFSVYLQFVIKDNALPLGFALSNAIKVNVLP